MKILNDKKPHRTYWVKKEITPDSVKTSFKDYSLENFLNDLDDVFENILIQTKGEMDSSWKKNTKKSIYYIMVNTGPNLKDIKIVARELRIPLKNVRSIARMYWYETKLLQSIFAREVKKIKLLPANDQMPAFRRLVNLTNNACGKFL